MVLTADRRLMHVKSSKVYWPNAKVSKIILLVWAKISDVLCEWAPSAKLNCLALCLFVSLTHLLSSQAGHDHFCSSSPVDWVEGKLFAPPPKKRIHNSCCVSICLSLWALVNGSVGQSHCSLCTRGTQCKNHSGVFYSDSHQRKHPPSPPCFPNFDIHMHSW